LAGPIRDAIPAAPNQRFTGIGLLRLGQKIAEM